MATPIWPISNLYFPLEHELHVGSVVNSFGSGYEQRIVTDFPRGPRSDGEGGQSTYVGQNSFRLRVRNLNYDNVPEAKNPSIDNSFKKLWSFYKSCFYDPVTRQIFWKSFYVYNPTENDDISTWTGEIARAGVDSQGVAVTNITGRYRVRFSDSSLSLTRFRACLYNGTLTLIEVAA